MSADDVLPPVLPKTPVRARHAAQRARAGSKEFPGTSRFRPQSNSEPVTAPGAGGQGAFCFVSMGR